MPSAGGFLGQPSSCSRRLQHHQCLPWLSKTCSSRNTVGSPGWGRFALVPWHCSRSRSALSASLAVPPPHCVSPPCPHPCSPSIPCCRPLLLLAHQGQGVPALHSPAWWSHPGRRVLGAMGAPHGDTASPTPRLGPRSLLHTLLAPAPSLTPCSASPRLEPEGTRPGFPVSRGVPHWLGDVERGNRQAGEQSRSLGTGETQHQARLEGAR